MIKAKSNFISPYFDILCDGGYGDFNDDGDEVDRTEQIFKCSVVCFSGNPNESLYSIQVT